MLTLRRKPSRDSCSDESTIDIQYKEEIVTLSLKEIYPHDETPFAVWWIYSSDWGNEKFPPKYVTLSDNQPLVINDFLKVYGSKITESNEAVMHLKAPRDAIIQRRDRK